MPKTRQQKQEEALIRQADHDALTIEQKIAKLKKKPGSCQKELAKLLKLKEGKGK